MLNGFNEREQLERLHDRHKRFSLDVYDHSSLDNHEKFAKAKTELKEVEKKLTALKGELHK